MRNIDDVKQARRGADKVIVNTAVQNVDFITEIAHEYGSQCIVGSIEAKQRSDGWEAFISNGRDATGLDVIDWAKRLEEHGVGEILPTSIDQEHVEGSTSTLLTSSISH